MHLTSNLVDNRVFPAVKAEYDREIAKLNRYAPRIKVDRFSADNGKFENFNVTSSNKYRPK